MPDVVLASIIFSSVYLLTCIIRWYVILKIVLFLGKEKEKDKTEDNKARINVL